jgi:DNA-binding LacI/PurR family transcriptional regulator
VAGDPGGMVTQKDLARRLGLSQQAVSFALNGKEGVSSETRDRVLAAAEELGYRVNAAARDLRGGRSRHIGVLMQSNPDMRGLHPAAWETVAGINHELASSEHYTTLIRFSDAIEHPQDLSRAFSEQVFGAMIVVALDPVFSERFEQLFPQAVWVDRHTRPRERAVWRDETAAGRLAAERLLAAGHRELVYLRSGWKGGAWDRERQAGAQAAVQAANATLQMVSIAPRKHDPFDRVPPEMVAGSGVLVAEAYLALRLPSLLGAAGLVPGRDLSICCADDAELLETAWPELDRIRFDRFALGCAAADMATSLAADPAAIVRSVVLPAEAVPGSTCLSG